MIVDDEIARLRIEFGRDEITEEELEAEIEFWLRVENCDFCSDGQLCAIHYGQYVGR